MYQDWGFHQPPALKQNTPCHQSLVQRNLHASSKKTTPPKKMLYRGNLSDIKPKKRFKWSGELHQDFIAGILDVGLKVATVGTLQHMLMLDSSYFTQISAHLQRLRHFRTQLRLVKEPCSDECLKEEISSEKWLKRKRTMLSVNNSNGKKQRHPDKEQVKIPLDISNKESLYSQLSRLARSESQLEMTKLIADTIFKQTQFHNVLEKALISLKGCQTSIWTLFEKPKHLVPLQPLSKAVSHPLAVFQPERLGPKQHLKLGLVQPQGKVGMPNVDVEAYTHQLPFGAAARALDANLRLSVGTSAFPNDLRELRQIVTLMGNKGECRVNGIGLYPLPASGGNEDKSPMLNLMALQSENPLHMQQMMQRRNEEASQMKKLTDANNEKSRQSCHLKWLLDGQVLDKELFDFIVETENKKT